MNLIRSARAFGAALALVLVGAVAHATLLLPAVQGPYLGDFNTNLYSITQAITLDSQMGFTTPITAGTASTQSACFQITNPLNNVVTSNANGSLCLPPAIAGREIFIGNAAGVTLNLYGSNTPFTSGTQDTINGTTGSTPYQNVTSSNKAAQCFSPANGVWYCQAGS